MNPPTYHPGPWYYVYGSVWNTPDGPEDGGQCIAMRSSNSTIDPSVKDRSLRLIAAAPDLLIELENAVAMLEESGITPSHRAYAAIGKAREPIPQLTENNK